MTILTVKELQVIYAKPGQPPVRAVDGVSFKVQAGESYGIVGESGCGKSSLARALIGLQPAAGGQILFEDVAARREVQMVFQDAAGSLNPRMTTRQTLAEVLRVHRVCPAGQLETRTAELLELVGLPHTVLDSYPRELSGGQCQRVSFARCLALEPKVLVADEPVSALDVSVQARILNLMRTLQRRLGLTIILISHDLAVVRNICDRVAVMYAGKFVEEGRVATIFAAPQHAYTRELLAAVPDVGRALAPYSTG